MHFKRNTKDVGNVSQNMQVIIMTIFPNQEDDTTCDIPSVAYTMKCVQCLNSRPKL